MNRFLFLSGFISFFIFAAIFTPAAHAQSLCCGDWLSPGVACTTPSGGTGTCSWSGGSVEPYLTACKKPHPPYDQQARYMSCLPNCNNVYCPVGSVIGANCNNAKGDVGTCQNPLHAEPYMTECPHAAGILACMANSPIPPCCLASQQGEACLINSTAVGNCRKPSGAMELVQCPLSNICALPTSSGSFFCTCEKLAIGEWNCHPFSAPDSCQSGNMPDSIQCSQSQNHHNPCGDDVSTHTSCNLPCVPGGNLAWGSYGPCETPNPNAIPPIPKSKLCVPGLLCYGGWCRKPNSSGYFADSCIWDIECGTCKSGNNCNVQMHCWKTNLVPDANGVTYGICDGKCGGTYFSDCVNPFCVEGDPTSGIRTAIGCIKTADTKAMTSQLLALALRLAGGISLLSMIYGGFIFVTSFGDKDKLIQGKTLFANSVIFVFFIAIVVVLINFLGVKVFNLDIFGFKL